MKPGGIKRNRMPATICRTGGAETELENGWFLSAGGQGAAAILSCRVGSSSLSAADGTRLQTER